MLCCFPPHRSQTLTTHIQVYKIWCHSFAHSATRVKEPVHMNGRAPQSVTLNGAQKHCEVHSKGAAPPKPSCKMGSIKCLGEVRRLLQRQGHRAPRGGSSQRGSWHNSLQLTQTLWLAYLASQCNGRSVMRLHVWCRSSWKSLGSIST